MHILHVFVYRWDLKECGMWEPFYCYQNDFQNSTFCTTCKCKVWIQIDYMLQNFMKIWLSLRSDSSNKTSLSLEQLKRRTLECQMDCMKNFQWNCCIKKVRNHSNRFLCSLNMENNAREKKFCTMTHWQRHNVMITEPDAW